MEWKVEEELGEPVSPTAQYFNSSVLSVSILAVLESQIPIGDLPVTSLLTNIFLPINPRFSSVMVKDDQGVNIWKKVQVNLKDHINIPTFVPPKTSEELYDEQFNNYMTKISMDQLPQSKPLWDIHIINYPTTRAVGHLVFKIHHSLGDGYSLMGALLSCLQRADNPSLPITFPILKKKSKPNNNYTNTFSSIPRLFSSVFNTVSDFGWSLLKSTIVEDDQTPIRSGADEVEHRLVSLTAMDFSLDELKQINSQLQVTINDVILAIVFLGVRLYMQESGDGFGKSNSTALVLLNTRQVNGYTSVEEMAKPNNKSIWGNQFAFLHVNVPKLDHKGSISNPINLVLKAHETLSKKKKSASIFLTGCLLETLRKFMGPEVAARNVHSTMKNATMAVSNVIGPCEQVSLDNRPISGMYFTVVGAPLSLNVTMISYMGKLTVALGAEKAYIDLDRLKLCFHKAFDMILLQSHPSRNGSNDDILNRQN